ncbi:uncharacterized protein (TIGR02646 family) [Rhizobium sp. PP-CC-2G-626]|nr:uncharacterized protein (TIGR02646 family) [Rhizobium sp. PP-CC-2G-626]
MIRINKLDKPAVLLENAERWTTALIEHDAFGTEPTISDLNKYNHEQVKNKLLEETNEKCAYCESKFRHVYYGDIEHVTPKKLAHSLRFLWENLTMSCSVCNTNKGTTEDLVDPNFDNPEEHFFVEGPTVLPNPLSVKGRLTELTIEMNRLHLIERRTVRLKALQNILTLAIQETDPDLKAVLFNELLIKETRDNVEFAAMSRAFVKNSKDRGLIP